MSIGRTNSFEDAMIKLAEAERADDPITEWELSTEDYYALASQPNALKYMGNFTKVPTLLNIPFRVCSKNSSL